MLIVSPKCNNVTSSFLPVWYLSWICKLSGRNLSQTILCWMTCAGRNNISWCFCLSWVDVDFGCSTVLMAQPVCIKYPLKNNMLTIYPRPPHLLMGSPKLRPHWVSWWCLLLIVLWPKTALHIRRGEWTRELEEVSSFVVCSDWCVIGNNFAQAGMFLVQCVSEHFAVGLAPTEFQTSLRLMNTRTSWILIILVLTYWVGKTTLMHWLWSGCRVQGASCPCVVSSLSSFYLAIHLVSSPSFLRRKPVSLWSPVIHNLRGWQLGKTIESQFSVAFSAQTAKTFGGPMHLQMSGTILWRCWQMSHH